MNDKSWLPHSKASRRWAFYLFFSPQHTTLHAEGHKYFSSYTPRPYPACSVEPLLTPLIWPASPHELEHRTGRKRRPSLTTTVGAHLALPLVTNSTSMTGSTHDTRGFEVRPLGLYGEILTSGASPTPSVVSRFIAIVFRLERARIPWQIPSSSILLLVIFIPRFVATDPVLVAVYLWLHITYIFYVHPSLASLAVKDVRMPRSPKRCFRIAHPSDGSKRAKEGVVTT